MRREGSIVGTLLFMLFGPLIWAADLLVVYGGHASYCAAGDRLPGDAEAVLPMLLWAATAAAGLIIAAGIVWPSLVRTVLRAMPATSPEAGFMERVMRWLALLSLFGVAFMGLALTLVPICAQLR